MKSFLKEYTDKKVSGTYLKNKLLNIAEDCDDEEDAADFYKLAKEIDESKQYIERITWEYFEDESNQNAENT